MTQTYQELLAQIAELSRQAEAQLAAEKSEAVAAIRAQMAEHGITAVDLGDAIRKSSLGSVVPKYCDSLGNTWSGRGKMPRWMASAISGGASRDDFKIA